MKVYRLTAFLLTIFLSQHVFANGWEDEYLIADHKSESIIKSGYQVKHKLKELSWADVDTKIILSQNIEQVTVSILPSYLSTYKQIAGSYDKNAFEPYSKSLNSLLESSEAIVVTLDKSIDQTQKELRNIKKASSCRTTSDCKQAYSDYLVNLFTSKIISYENQLSEAINYLEPYEEAYQD